MIVIGDHIIDTYIMGKSIRLSPEAPVPVVTNTETISKPGGATNVVINLRSFGEHPLYIRNLNQKTEKTRILANGHVLCRIDDEKYTPFTPDLDLDLSEHSFAIISDYNKGVVHDPQTIIQTLNSKGIRVLVDPKKPLVEYRGAWLIKMNKKEFEEETKLPFERYSSAILCRDLCNEYGFEHIIVTLGDMGCVHYTHGLHNLLLIHADSKNVVDVTGAGDVFIAALAHFINRGEDVRDAAEKANKLAGISVSHLGTYTLTQEDIESVDKPKIVFTNGCFDILHPGHIHLLHESKKLGQKLIVGLNSDASIKRLKGRNRPILSQDRRKKMLEALGIADEVIIFDEDTPFELIQSIKPDIITKGGDYVPETVVGAALAKVVIIPSLKGYSTTGVINEVIRKS